MNDDDFSTFTNSSPSGFSEKDLELIKKYLKELEALETREHTLLGIIVTDKFSSGKVLQANGFYFFISSKTFNEIKKIAEVKESPTISSSIFGVPIIESDETAYKIMIEGEFREYERYLRIYSSIAGIPPQLITGV